MTGGRPSWDETWMAVAHTIARRSRCVRSQAGAVIVSPAQRIVATGYNGPPAGFKMRHETFPGCLRVLNAQDTCDAFCPRAQTGGGLSYDDCVASHSEANALMYSERDARQNGTLYSTRVPCFMCAKMIANSGLSRVVYVVAPEDVDRAPHRTHDMLEQSGIEVVTSWRTQD